MTVRAIWLRLALSSALVCGALAGAQAQTYPSKPVRLVLPYAPGGIIDYVGRTLAQKLTENLGQPVVAETGPVLVAFSAPIRSPARPPTATRWC